MSCIAVDFKHSKGRINRNIYGHFAEHIGGVFYDGLWVGPESTVENVNGFRKALVDSFKKICPPILRWPGGCFAETYDWRDGIGPRSQRPRRVNWWYSCDHRVESNQVGTHEFIDFCRMVGAEPYIAANITSLTPLAIRDWIEYCNLPAGTTTLADQRAANGSEEPFNVRYWGIGNENWGGGGQMSPEMYAREYIRYSTILKSLGQNDMKLILCGADGHTIPWTRRVMQEWRSHSYHEIETYGMSVHYYTRYHGDDPVHFTEDEWYGLMHSANYMTRIIDDHRAAMDEFDPERRMKLIIDEWGNWHKDGSGPSRGYNLFEQQSTLRDAVVAALTLNIFNNHCDVVDMANVAQLCNNLHSLYLASEDKFVETPNYFVFDMFKGHQDGQQLETYVDSSAHINEKDEALDTLSASASIKEGVLTLTMANLDLTASQNVTVQGLFGRICGEATYTVLSSADPRDCNTFEEPYKVHPVTQHLTLTDNDTLVLPPASVAVLTVQLAEGNR